MASRKSSRSSALSIASAVAPIISDVEFFQDAHLAQAQRAVERGLPAHGRQQRVGALPLDDLGDDFRRDRLDVSCVGEIGIGHDRRRVRVHQDDPVALFLERLARLGAGIIELASLADHDRTRADDQDRFDVGSFRHPVIVISLSSFRDGRRPDPESEEAGTVLVSGFGFAALRRPGMTNSRHKKGALVRVPRTAPRAKAFARGGPLDQNRRAGKGFARLNGG